MAEAPFPDRQTRLAFPNAKVNLGLQVRQRPDGVAHAVAGRAEAEEARRRRAARLVREQPVDELEVARDRQLGGLLLRGELLVELHVPAVITLRGPRLRDHAELAKYARQRRRATAGLARLAGPRRRIVFFRLF